MCSGDLEVITYLAPFCLISLTLIFLGPYFIFCQKMQLWSSSTLKLSVWRGSIYNYDKDLNMFIDHMARAKEEREDKNG